MRLANMPNGPFAIGGRGSGFVIAVVVVVDEELCESSFVCELALWWSISQQCSQVSLIGFK